jgi:8-amino-7-oxononanoate synthase
MGVTPFWPAPTTIWVSPSSPECIEAGQNALEEFGTGTTGSRIANGSYAIHEELEHELAGFLGMKQCIVFSTGYQANLGMMAGLAGPKDTIFLDADSHSSIYDGCTLSGCQAGALPPQ